MARLASFTSRAMTTLQTSVVLNRPTGLAVGDILLAFIITGTNITITPPAGFTLSLDVPGSGADTIKIYTKTATSGDVSASTFTFTHASETSGGFMCRVTEFDTTTAIPNYDGASGITNTSTPDFSADINFTTTIPSTLLIRVLSASGSSTTVTLTGFATTIEASVPTGTTRAIGLGSQLFNSTGLTPSYTASGGTVSTDWAAVQVVVNPLNANITETVSLTEIQDTPRIRLADVQDTLTLTDSENFFKAGRQWNDQTKSTKTWTDLEK